MGRRNAGWKQIGRSLLPVLLSAIIAVSGVLPVQAKGKEDWLASDTIGTVTKETEVSLRDDFAAATTKEWRASAQIPEGYRSNSSFTEREIEVDAQKRSFLTDSSLTGHDAELVQNFYSLLTDWETRDALGVSPVMEEAGRLLQIRTIEEMTEYLKSSYPDKASLTSDFWEQKGMKGSGLFGLSVSRAIDFPDYYTVHIEATDLSMEDTAEYTQTTQAGQIKKEQWQQKGQYMLERIGCSEEQARAILEEAFAFETKAAQYMLPKSAEYGDDYYRIINNGCDREGLEEISGAFPLTEILDAIGMGESDSYLLMEPEWLAGMQSLYTQENLEGIRDYLLVNYLISWMPYLDRGAYEKELEVRQLAGEAISRDDGLNAYQTVKKTLAGPMQNLYVQKYGSEQMRREVTEIIGEVISYYRQMLSQETWLSEETRALAIEKLDHLGVFVGYADELTDYSDLTIRSAAQGGTLAEAVLAINRGTLAKERENINQKEEEALFPGEVTVVNAYYDPQANTIFLPIGILGGAFYNESMSREQKLGAIGAVIGHEITHAFDSLGAQFDKDGALASWWSEEDYAAFSARVAKVAEYYSSIIPIEGQGYYNGEQVQAEATADLGGLKCMLAIAAQEPDFNYDEFFRSYANMWKSASSEAREIILMHADTHPLDYLRINVGVQQFQEFYDTYDIQQGDGMYLAPGERLEVW